MPTLFNDLLRESGIAPNGVRLLRHHTKPGIGNRSLSDLWHEDQAGFNLYQSTQRAGRRIFRTGQQWASFVSPAPGRTLFVGLYDAKYLETRAVDWTCPYRGDKPGGGKPVDVFLTTLRPELSEFIDKLEINWDPASVRSWVRCADEAPFTVVERPSPQIVGTNKAALTSALQSIGFQEVHSTQKVMHLKRESVNLYIKREADRHPVVLHPIYFDLASRLAMIDGVKFDWPVRPYINSNMREFPVYEASGRGTWSRFGFAINVRPESLATLIELLERGMITETTEGNLRLVGSGNEPLTEREHLAAARIGQGVFRAALIAMWGGSCPLAGIDHPELLRASHIKPWRSSSSYERLDCYNGLLLSANVDALFDRGFISFADNGKVLVSSALSAKNLELMGLDQEACLDGLKPAHLPYLAYHRSVVFRP